MRFQILRESWTPDCDKIFGIDLSAYADAGLEVILQHASSVDRKVLRAVADTLAGFARVTLEVGRNVKQAVTLIARILLQIIKDLRGEGTGTGSGSGSGDSAVWSSPSAMFACARALMTANPALVLMINPTLTTAISKRIDRPRSVGDLIGLLKGLIRAVLGVGDFVLQISRLLGDLIDAVVLAIEKFLASQSGGVGDRARSRSLSRAVSRDLSLNLSRVDADVDDADVDDVDATADVGADDASGSDSD